MTPHNGEVPEGHPEHPGYDGISAQIHLSPEQFGPETVADHEGWSGPLGSFGEPGPAAAYWQNSGVVPDIGDKI